MENPILITGASRSGTSMITAALNACGAFGGEMSKRGMYSNDRIREEIVKEYFQWLKVDPNGQYPLPQTKDLFIPMDWKSKIMSILREQGYSEGSWIYKDARSCLIWPIWNHSFPNAKWIIVRRRTGDIVKSCMHTGYMVGHSTEKGWIDWVREHEKKFVEMVTEGLNCKIIWPERMIHGDYYQLYELCEWLGLTWNKKALNFIDPLLWGSKQKERSK